MANIFRLLYIRENPCSSVALIDNLILSKAHFSRINLKSFLKFAQHAKKLTVNSSMKQLRHNRKWLLLIPGVVILIFAFNGNSQPSKITQAQPRDASKLKPPSVTASAGPIIPGLQQNAIPQGITYAPKQNRILISHYFRKAPAFISVLNASTGKMISSIKLQEPSGKLHYGHVGGIAALNDFLFVASDGYVLQYKLAEFLSDNAPVSIRPITMQKCETTASFCTATDNLLLVGEFACGISYRTNPSHHMQDRNGVHKYAWVCGYDNIDPPDKPKCILSIRQKVQGMSVSGDRIFLSISYGRTSRSIIAVYRNPIGEPGHKMITMQNGDTIPLWFLDGRNYLGEIDFPPMSEGIVMINNRLAVLSESGASKYRIGGQGPLDRLLLLDISSFR